MNFEICKREDLPTKRTCRQRPGTASKYAPILDAMLAGNCVVIDGVVGMPYERSDAHRTKQALYQYLSRRMPNKILLTRSDGKRTWFWLEDRDAK